MNLNELAEEIHQNAVERGWQENELGLGETIKSKLHLEICKYLNDIYIKKNHDYGDSFAKLRHELSNVILVRIYDKYSRLKTLLECNDQLVEDESIEDTLMDLANYCIMELVERKIDNGN